MLDGGGGGLIPPLPAVTGAGDDAPTEVEVSDGRAEGAATALAFLAFLEAPPISDTSTLDGFDLFLMALLRLSSSSPASTIGLEAVEAGGTGTWSSLLARRLWPVSRCWILAPNAEGGT